MHCDFISYFDLKVSTTFIFAVYILTYMIWLTLISQKTIDPPPSPSSTRARPNPRVTVSKPLSSSLSLYELLLKNSSTLVLFSVLTTRCSTLLGFSLLLILVTPKSRPSQIWLRSREHLRTIFTIGKFKYIYIILHFWHYNIFHQSYYKCPSFIVWHLIWIFE